MGRKPKVLTADSPGVIVGDETLLAPQYKKKYTRIKGNPRLETAVLVKHMAGQNMQQIADDLGVARQTVSCVLNTEEMQRYVEYGRSRAVSLIPRSLDVAEYRLKKNDGTMALGILRGTQVLINQQPPVNTTNNFAFVMAQMEQTATKDAQEGANSEQSIDAEAIVVSSAAPNKQPDPPEEQ